METNKIIEIYKGHYQTILDFPNPTDLFKIVDVSYKYIWGFEHRETQIEWSNYDFLLFDKKVDINKVKVRNIEMEYLIETSSFLEIIPHIHQTVRIIQTNHMPPFYLDIKNLSGKKKYDLLKDKIDYLFELEMPGAIDYTPLISPSVHFLEGVIDRIQAKN